MSEDRFLRRKLTIEAHGERTVLVKNSRESSEHVLIKGLIWALYLPQYPGARIEMRVGDPRYKPDISKTDAEGRVIFWGESGVAGREKLATLARRYPDTHFAWGKWDRSLKPYEEMLRPLLAKARRRAPFDLLRFDQELVDRCWGEDGLIQIRFEDVEWLRLE